ncbi:MAG: hypothetical protein JXB32_24500 [Deltaproteobacteria bacterium]|nr:hypothetical protein [Deltaproteobacteria bacterium]
MTRLLAAFAACGCLFLGGCDLAFHECGTEGLHCEGDESVCICSTGRCAEPDHRCESGLHYFGGRCVPVSEAASAVASTPDNPNACYADARTDVRDETSDRWEVYDTWY